MLKARVTTGLFTNMWVIDDLLVWNSVDSYLQCFCKVYATIG